MSGLVFGNYIPGSIHGYKCEDVDGDGYCFTEDADGRVIDRPFPDVPIMLVGHTGLDPETEVRWFTRTNGAGEFWFDDIPPGTYDVKELVNPVGLAVHADTGLPVAGLPDQGELLDENGEVAFPVDNVMESGVNLFRADVTSRVEFVWRKGAGHLNRYCFPKESGLVQVEGDITHILCSGDMATHTVTVEVGMPDNAYSVSELEFGGAKDGDPANWTSGTHNFSVPSPVVGAADLDFQGEIKAGQILWAEGTGWKISDLPETLNSAWDDGTVVAAQTVAGPGTGAKFAVTVDGAGDIVLTLVDRGENYDTTSKLLIPFSVLDDDNDTLGFFPDDNVGIEVLAVESSFVDLWLPGADPGTTMQTCMAPMDGCWSVAKGGCRATCLRSHHLVRSSVMSGQ